MPTAKDVKKGAYFKTNTGQLRKVTDVTKDESGTQHVHYVAKSATLKNRKFEPAHTKANPPTMDTFLNDCGDIVSNDDLAVLRKTNVLTEGE